MGFFDRRKIRRHKQVVMAMADQNLGEAQRVYENQLEVMAREFRPVEPTAVGIYAARLFSGTFVAWPFRDRWPNKSKDSLEVLEVVSGLAAYSLSLPEASHQLEMDEPTREFGSTHFLACLRAIDSEFEHGPSRASLGDVTAPDLDAYAETFGLSNDRRAQLAEAAASAPMNDCLTDGFRELKRLWLKGLELSAGELEESERERFAHVATGIVHSNLSLLGNVAALLH